MRESPAVAQATVLALTGITKQFPGVLANDNVDFELLEGEVHALLGENGAGKSTLMNILYGLYHPDAGEIQLKGKKTSFGSAKDAIDAGIGMVHQHFMLIPVMTVAENIVLAQEPTYAGVMLDVGEARRRVTELSDRYGLAVDPDARIQDITVAQQQRVEILKALYRGAEILVLDEPTAVLTPQEARELFAIIAELKAQGKSIIFISHKLHEVLEVADRITVLRRGKKIDTVPKEGATEESLARMMVGREVLLRVDKQPARPGDAPGGGGPARLRRTRAGEGARRLVRGARARDRRHRGSRRQRPDGADRRTHRPAAAGERHDHGRRTAGRRQLTAREMLDLGVGTSPRTASGAASCSSSRSRRTSRSTTTPTAPAREAGLAVPEAADHARGAADQGLRRPRRRAEDARRRPLGRKPAEGRRRP